MHQLTDWPNKEVEAFYSQLENAISKISRKDITIIQGHFNARIGKDAHTDWSETAGTFGMVPTNERGAQLLEFARMNNMAIAYTHYRHQHSRNITWTISDGINQSINQSNFYSANIPGIARLSGATARSVFKCEVIESFRNINRQ